MEKIIVQEIQSCSKKKEGNWRQDRNQQVKQALRQIRFYGKCCYRCKNTKEFSINFQRKKFEWEKKLNEWNYNDEVVPVFPYHILGELKENDQPRKKEEFKEKKKQKFFVFSGAPGESNFGVPKEDTIEKPKKKAENKNNPKQVKTIGMFVEDIVKKKEQKEKSDADESSDEDGRTLKDLFSQAAKDKKEIMDDAHEKVKGKDIVEEEKLSDDDEEEQDNIDKEREEEKIDDNAGSEKDDNEEAGNSLNGQ
ncbi:uncharacterized protein LOC127103604 [Lathyrus oleraceus]|uniref:uncharacterized protein LOC127103604 n=1 Tax=Pisum sativum TaxID=3888 RepID=UPI0021CE62F2|nr:uncharacterized protein LOC127103604 [Pisum sativum]